MLLIYVGCMQVLLYAISHKQVLLVWALLYVGFLDVGIGALVWALLQVSVWVLSYICVGSLACGFTSAPTA